MKSHITEPTSKTPEIIVDYDQSIIKVLGRAMCESCLDLFLETIINVRSNIEHMPNALTLIIRLEYCNSQCSKGLFKLIEFLTETNTLPMKIEWHYELDDDFILDLGQELEKISGQKFEFIVA